MSRDKRSKSPRPRNPAELAAEIARIGGLDAPALKALWPAWYGKASPGSPPARAPARMQRTTLALALAHRMQCDLLGGVSKASSRTLDAVAAQEFGETSARPSVPPPRRLKAGSKLVREWHGVVHEVAVVEDGFAWNGARHRSLSAIARAITGTRWNGLVFFGLKSAGSSKVRAAAISQKSAEPVDG